MFKSATFAALALLATVSAATAAIKAPVLDASAIETMQQSAKHPKPKSPPRNLFGLKPSAAEKAIQRLQFVCGADDRPALRHMA